MRRQHPLRTVHGEPLERRYPSGWGWRAAYAQRDVYCPTCGAEPRRRCTWSSEQEDLLLPTVIVLLPETEAERRTAVVRFNKEGRCHIARGDRAHLLDEAARERQLSRFVSVRTLVRPHRSVMEAFAGLPLFRTPAR